LSIAIPDRNDPLFARLWAEVQAVALPPDVQRAVAFALSPEVRRIVEGASDVFRMLPPLETLMSTLRWGSIQHKRHSDTTPGTFAGDVGIVFQGDFLQASVQAALNRLISKRFTLASVFPHAVQVTSASGDALWSQLVRPALYDAIKALPREWHEHEASLYSQLLADVSKRLGAGLFDLYVASGAAVAGGGDSLESKRQHARTEAFDVKVKSLKDAYPGLSYVAAAIRLGVERHAVENAWRRHPEWGPWKRSDRVY